MSKIKEFEKIMEKSDTNKIVIITNHYQITGFVYNCGECNKEIFINLTNASICMKSENYGLECDRYSSSNFDWLHVNLEKIIAFSFIKE